MVEVPLPRTLSVLLAEDDENDVILLQAGFARAGLPLRLFVVRNGEEALDCLSGKRLPGQPDLPCHPDLLLLDISMPLVDGFQVLRWLRARPEFRSLPVIILSYSILASDRQAALQLGANDFHIKPRSIDGIMAMIHQLYARYLRLKANAVIAPSSPPPPPLTP